MDKKFITFIKGISLLAIGLIAISLLLVIYVPAIPLTRSFLYIILFIYLFTLLVYRVLLKGQQERLSHFVNVYMLVNFGKLVVYIIIIFVYAFLNRSDAVSFILTFFIYYFFFTSYEIISLLKMNR